MSVETRLIDAGVFNMGDKVAVVRGRGNAFREQGVAHADVLQAKSLLGAKIVTLLDELALSVRQAQRMTGFAASDFSRVRSADLDRFTVDRLMKMVEALDEDLRIAITIKPSKPATRRR